MDRLAVIQMYINIIEKYPLRSVAGPPKANNGNVSLQVACNGLGNTFLPRFPMTKCRIIALRCVRTSFGGLRPSSAGYS